MEEKEGGGGRRRTRGGVNKSTVSNNDLDNKAPKKKGRGRPPSKKSLANKS